MQQFVNQFLQAEQFVDQLDLLDHRHHRCADRLDDTGVDHAGVDVAQLDRDGLDRTRDEVPDPHALKLQLWVNDVLKQDGATDDLIFNIPQIIEYVSEAVTLQPGDIFFTGTPAGVGPLAEGQTVSCHIEGIGTLVNPVVLP